MSLLSFLFSQLTLGSLHKLFFETYALEGGECEETAPDDGADNEAGEGGATSCDTWHRPKSRFWEEACRAREGRPQRTTSSEVKGEALSAASEETQDESLPLETQSQVECTLSVSPLLEDSSLESTYCCGFSAGGTALADTSSTSGLVEDAPCVPNQDAFFLRSDVGGDSSAVLLGVADGYGPSGADIAKAVVSLLPAAVEAKLKRNAAPATGVAHCTLAVPQLEAVVELRQKAEAPLDASAADDQLSPRSDALGFWSSSSSEESNSEAGSPCGLPLGSPHLAQDELRASPVDITPPSAGQTTLPSTGSVAGYGEDLDVIEPTALETVFAEVEEAIAKDSSLFPLCSGSTATLAFIQGNQLTVAHTGDSSCILGLEGPNNTTQAVQLTIAHWPEEPQERRRIEGEGGQILAHGGDPHVARVFNKSMEGLFGGLPLSRSLGGLLLKRRGVISTPEIMRITLDRSAKFLIIGTSGLWNALSPNEAVMLVGTCSDSSQAARSLVEAARLRWIAAFGANCVEDVTAVVYFF